MCIPVLYRSSDSMYNTGEIQPKANVVQDSYTVKGMTGSIEQVTVEQIRLRHFVPPLPRSGLALYGRSGASPRREPASGTWIS